MGNSYRIRHTITQNGIIEDPVVKIDRMINTNQFDNQLIIQLDDDFVLTISGESWKLVIEEELWQVVGVIDDVIELNRIKYILDRIGEIRTFINIRKYLK